MGSGSGEQVVVEPGSCTFRLDFLAGPVKNSTFQPFERDSVIEVGKSFADDTAIVAAVGVAAGELADTARPGHLGKELESAGTALALDTDIVVVGSNVVAAAVFAVVLASAVVLVSAVVALASAAAAGCQFLLVAVVVLALLCFCFLLVFAH